MTIYASITALDEALAVHPPLSSPVYQPTTYHTPNSGDSAYFLSYTNRIDIANSSIWFRKRDFGGHALRPDKNQGGKRSRGGVWVWGSVWVDGELREKGRSSEKTFQRLFIREKERTKKSRFPPFYFFSLKNISNPAPSSNPLQKKREKGEMHRGDWPVFPPPSLSFSNPPTSSIFTFFQVPPSQTLYMWGFKIGMANVWYVANKEKKVGLGANTYASRKGEAKHISTRFLPGKKTPHHFSGLRRKFRWKWNYANFSEPRKGGVGFPPNQSVFYGDFLTRWGLGPFFSPPLNVSATETTHT